MSNPAPHLTAFDGHHLLSSGALADVALAVKAAIDAGSTGVILVFDNATGRVVDLDLRGTADEIVARLSPPAENAPEPRGRGRPSLGVVAREVTLLPRQWDWLAAQPGGASAVLRKLVDEARKQAGGQHDKRVAHNAAYHFMLAMAGDLPGYEDATRALFADDLDGLVDRIGGWPDDIRTHILRLASPPENQP